MNDVLVIVPCGRKKIWDQKPNAGPTAARDAYSGAPFSVNRAYAEKFASRWMILSAKYGLVAPDFVIPGPYDTTFKKRASGPVSTDRLREQVLEQDLAQYGMIIGLGGKEYRKALELAFAGTGASLVFPFAGLPIGRMMQQTRAAIATNAPGWKRPGMNAATGLAPAANGACRELHEILGHLQKFGFAFSDAEIPQNGLYVVFETGECGHGCERIVRVGTHTGDGKLRARLKEHFVTAAKDRSIFRKNIGRCLLNRARDPFLEVWELDLTTRAARALYADRIDLVRQQAIERQVSLYIRSNCRFVVIEVHDKAARLDLESKIASTVAQCDQCRPSATWLGLHSPKRQIRETGLWQVNQLSGATLTSGDLKVLRETVPGFVSGHTVS